MTALERAQADGSIIGTLWMSPYLVDRESPAILNYKGRYFQAATHEQALQDALAHFDSAGSAD
jgi:hypothetical protein